MSTKYCFSLHRSCFWNHINELKIKQRAISSYHTSGIGFNKPYYYRKFFNKFVATYFISKKWKPISLDKSEFLNIFVMTCNYWKYIWCLIFTLLENLNKFIKEFFLTANWCHLFSSIWLWITRIKIVFQIDYQDTSVGIIAKLILIAAHLVICISLYKFVFHDC